jgi:hypothetical protein
MQYIRCSLLELSADLFVASPKKLLERNMFTSLVSRSFTDVHSRPPQNNSKNGLRNILDRPSCNIPSGTINVKIWPLLIIISLYEYVQKVK